MKKLKRGARKVKVKIRPYGDTISTFAHCCSGGGSCGANCGP